MDLSYTVKKSRRARAMRVSVYPDGAVVVTSPRWGSESSIRAFVAKYWSWITRQVERTRGREIIYIQRGDIPLLKRRALEIAEERCTYFAARYGFSFGSISIRSQKTRWGSCSERGNLSFNYKIAVLPQEIADYIVVHELCHRGAFDHSKRFWELVAREIPEHRHIRKRLREIAFVFR